MAATAYSNKTLYDMMVLSRALSGSVSILKKHHPVTITDMRIPRSVIDKYDPNLQTFEFDGPFLPSVLHQHVEKLMVFPFYRVHPDVEDYEVSSVFSDQRYLEKRSSYIFWCVVPPTYEWESFLLAFSQNTSFRGVLVVESERTEFIKSLEEGFFVHEIDNFTYLSTIDFDWNNGNIFDEEVVAQKLSLQVQYTYEKGAGRKSVQKGNDSLAIADRDAIKAALGEAKRDIIRSPEEYKDLISVKNWRSVLAPLYAKRDPFPYTGKYSSGGGYLSFQHAYLAEKDALAGESTNRFSIESDTDASKAPIKSGKNARRFTGGQEVEWNEEEMAISRNIWLAIAESDPIFRSTLLATNTADIYYVMVDGDRRLTDLEEARSVLRTDVAAKKVDTLRILISEKKRNTSRKFPPGEIEGEEVYHAYDLDPDFRYILSHFHVAEFPYKARVLQTPDEHYKAVKNPNENTWAAIYRAKLESAADSDELTLFKDTLLATQNASLFYTNGDSAEFLEVLRSEHQDDFAEADDDEDASTDDDVDDYEDDDNEESVDGDIA